MTLAPVAASQISERLLPICLKPVLYKVLDKILMNRVDKYLQDKWPQRTLCFRARHQAAEAHVAIAQALACGREYDTKVAVAKGDFRKAFDAPSKKCTLRPTRVQTGRTKSTS